MLFCLPAHERAMELLKNGRALLSLPSISHSLALLAFGIVGFVFACILTFKMGLVSIPISSLQLSSTSSGAPTSTLFPPPLPSSLNLHGSPQQENPQGCPDCAPPVDQSSRLSYSPDLEALAPLNAHIEALDTHAQNRFSKRIDVNDTHSQNGFSNPIDVNPPVVDDTNDTKDKSFDNVSSPTPSNSLESSAADDRKHAHNMFSSISTDEELAECDMYRGKWIEDDSYPLYKADSCPFISEKFNCQRNGRPDTKYTRWRWVPKDCNWPRFSGTAMLESLRGKRLVFVGDSLNKNQWESLLCMLRESLVDKRRVVHRRGSNRVLRFLDYNCSVELYTSHYLVGMKKGSDDTNFTIRLDTMDKTAPKWRNADVLVFNTVHWWGPDKIGYGENRFQEGNKVYKRLGVMAAYKKALSMWGKWVDTHVDPRVTRVFFRAYSPQHFRGGRWNSGGHCEDETEPLHEAFHVVTYPKNVMQALQEVIGMMKVHVNVLNITNLSTYRKDAHPGVYWHSQNLEAKQQDCGHWCLPGLPDAWNELLYFSLTNGMPKSP